VSPILAGARTCDTNETVDQRPELRQVWIPRVEAGWARIAMAAVSDEYYGGAGGGVGGIGKNRWGGLPINLWANGFMDVASAEYPARTVLISIQTTGGRFFGFGGRSGGFGLATDNVGGLHWLPSKTTPSGMGAAEAWRLNKRQV